MKSMMMRKKMWRSLVRTMRRRVNTQNSGTSLASLSN
nr:HSP90-like protein [Arabidopsis thaliana]